MAGAHNQGFLLSESDCGRQPQGRGEEQSLPWRLRRAEHILLEHISNVTLRARSKQLAAVLDKPFLRDDASGENVE